MSIVGYFKCSHDDIEKLIKKVDKCRKMLKSVDELDIGILNLDGRVYI